MEAHSRLVAVRSAPLVAISRLCAPGQRPALLRMESLEAAPAATMFTTDESDSSVTNAPSSLTHAGKLTLCCQLMMAKTGIVALVRPILA